MKIRDKKRFFAVMTAAVAIAAGAAGCVALSDDTPVDAKEYVVKSGDTLWSIAEEHCPKSMDKRLYIYMAAKENGIENCMIRPGDVLILK